MDMILGLRWQRLVDEIGETCDRCGGTQGQLAEAVESLRSALAPLGIQVALEETTLSRQECADDVLESNRIWIAGRPLEDWLGAEVGASECGSCCAKLGENVSCRTTTLEGREYEVIPAELIIKAGLEAAAHIMQAPEGGPCCPPDKCCP